MKKKVIILFIIITFISLIVTTSNSFAKYVANHSWTYNMKTKAFYFESDVLGGTGTEIVNSSWDESEIGFDIKNYNNKKLISDFDIDYTLSCEVKGDLSEYLSCDISEKGNELKSTLVNSGTCENTNGDSVDVSSFTNDECITGGYTWSSNIVEKEYTLNILNSNNYEYSDLEVIVMAASTSPYKKELEATFKLHKETSSNIISEFNNYSTYGRLSVNNPNSNSKCIMVKWDSDNQIIDTNELNVSSSAVSEDGYINQIIFNLDSNNSKYFMFFNKTSEERSIDDFSIEEINNC